MSDIELLRAVLDNPFTWGYLALAVMFLLVAFESL